MRILKKLSTIKERLGKSMSALKERLEDTGCTLLVALFLALAIIAIKRSINWIFQTAPARQQTQERMTAEEVQEFTEKVNERLENIKLKKVPFGFAGEESLGTYQIILNANGKDDPFLRFDAYAYSSQGGGTGGIVPEVDLCDVANRAIEKETKVVQIIRDSRPKSIAPLADAKEILVEFLVLLKLLPKVRAEKELLIKGFADGDLGGQCEELQTEGWCREIKQAYSFRQIRLYPPTQRNDPNPIIYDRRHSEIAIPHYYQNRHLPDLRAKFAQHAFVDKMLSVCPFNEDDGRPPVDSHILKGFEYTDRDPAKRKVQIFLHVH